jgi:rod shape-determining protein MreC
MKIKKFFYPFLFLLIFFLILLLNLPFFSKPVKNFFNLISSPVQNFFWQSGKKVSNFISGISKASVLKKENERLNLQIQDLLQKIASLKELEKENERLREALGIGLEKEYKLILTNVIGRETSPNFFRVDKGKKDGVEKDMPIINESKVLCGKVSEVYENFSEVQTISNKNLSFTVKIPGQEAIFSAKGMGNSKVLLDLIPKDVSINTSDLVITSAEGGFFPKDLLVGKIEKVEKSDLEPFQKAEVSLACQIEKVEFLFIIKEW